LIPIDSHKLEALPSNILPAPLSIKSAGAPLVGLYGVITVTGFPAANFSFSSLERFFNIEFLTA
jgi:hypothetical protein